LKLSRQYETHIKVFVFRKFLLVIFSTILKFVHNTKIISCDSVSDQFFEKIEFQRQKTCSIGYFGSKVVIDSPGYSISNRDDSIEALHLDINKLVFYLPEKVDTNFKNLVIYEANGCSIKNISNQNFKGLIKLCALLLENNQIEKILSDTFKDLKELQYLWLSKKIFLNFCPTKLKLFFQVATESDF
jgi:Leucine rich repeat